MPSEPNPTPERKPMTSKQIAIMGLLLFAGVAAAQSGDTMNLPLCGLCLTYKHTLSTDNPSPGSVWYGVGDGCEKRATK